MGLFRPLVTHYEAPPAPKKKPPCRQCDGTGKITVSVGASSAAEKTVKCGCR